eukprot:TRINITY_DN1821_c0_g1_i2.p1 TRINITY_DN1821_c0_g1~~TRINITY_DN1821_c0_g1_i2.p1  ORF type:complete len:224 (+),score=37.95 TRINITY_DN1821_c0_g1_i2:201-872(+)
MGSAQFLSGVVTSSIRIVQFLSVQLLMANGGLFVGGIANFARETVVNGPLAIQSTMDTTAILVKNTFTSNNTATFHELKIFGSTKVDVIEVSASMTVLLDVNSNKTIRATGLCISDDCRRDWPTQEEVEPAVISQLTLSFDSGAEEIFLIGVFDGFREFSVQVDVEEGFGVFETSVLKGVSDGIGIGEYSDHLIQEGTFWGSVSRIDSGDATVRARVSVLSVF